MRKKSCFFVSLLLCVLLTGCSGNETILSEAPSETAAPVTEEMTTEVQQTEETETQSVVPAENGVNPLTGEAGYSAEAVGKRPVAVMVNNAVPSYPQYGLAEADLLYELPVEGGVTRLMAVYADYTAVPDVCSVRSSRYYFPQIAAGLDAIYCHWGAEQNYAVSTMKSLGTDRLDGAKLGNSILFYRDPERVGKYASEHTGYLKGSDLPAAIAKCGIREEAVGETTAFLFADELVVPSDAGCVRVEIPFSDSSSTEFTYDPSQDVYLMSHNDSPQMDGHAQTQVAFTNVFILQTNVTSLDESNYLRRVELEGGGGYYVSMGGVEEISWEKADDHQPIRVYAADGSELEVNIGSSYIAVVGKGRRISFTDGFDGEAPLAY